MLLSCLDVAVKDGGLKVRYHTPINVLRNIGIIQEEENLFHRRPGFTFGISSRMDVKKWDFNEVKTWPKCCYTLPPARDS